MNKIYIGDSEITTGGGSSFNPSDYVDTSTWNEHENVIASALVHLKELSNESKAEEIRLNNQIDSYKAQLDASINTKADASTVYTKSEIDNSDMIVASFLTSLNDRVSSIETSVGSGDGCSFDPTVINASVNALESVTDDISTLSNNIKNGTQVLQRVIAAPDGLTNYHASKDSQKEVYNVVGQTPENYYLDGTDAPIVFRVGASNIDAFRVKGYKSTDNLSRKIEYYDRFNDSMKDLAEMINYLDASAIGFDTSIKSISTEINSSVNDISSRVSAIETDYIVSDDLSTFITGNDISTFITGNDISTFITGNDVSPFITENDISTFVDESDVSAYVRNYTYDKETIDTMVQSGGGGGEGGSADLTNYYTKAQIDTSVSNYAYNKSYIDSSFNHVYEGFDIIGGDLQNLFTNKANKADIDTSWNSIPTIIDTSLKAYTYGKTSIDASYGVLDASVIALDASVRALAASGGGSAPDMTNYYTKTQSDSSLTNYAYSKSYIDSSYSHVDASIQDIEYSIDSIADNLEMLDTSATALDNKINDVSVRMPIFEYNSATQTLNIIA